MDWITSISNAFTQLANLSKERLSTLVILALFVFGFYMQYKRIESLELKDEKHGAQCTSVIHDLRIEHNKSMQLQAVKFQDQIDSFILKKNVENDSVYNYFYSVIRKYNKKILNINEELHLVTEKE